MARNHVSCPAWLSPGSYNMRGLSQPLVSRGGWVWRGNPVRQGRGSLGRQTLEVRGRRPWRGLWSHGFVFPKIPLSLPPGLYPPNSPCPPHQGLTQTPCPQLTRHAPVTRHRKKWYISVHTEIGGRGGVENTFTRNLPHVLSLWLCCSLSIY